MKSTTNLNEVQKLAGKIAALNRFMSRSTDKSLLILRVLRKIQTWVVECEKVFAQLKEYLVHPLLSQTKHGEPLLLYLSVTPNAIFIALIREEGSVQRLVYYISRALRGAGTQYPKVKMITFAVVTTAHQPKPYF